MKKILKLLIGLTLVAALLFGGLRIADRYYNLGLFVPSGWNTGEDGARRYLNSEKVPIIGWQQIGGHWYYFDPARDGAMATGWLELSTGRYRLDENGIRVTGWLTENGSTWYLDPHSGAMLTGWQQIGENYYYLHKITGQLHTGWLDRSGERVYMARSGGAMLTGWQQIDGKTYLLDPSTGVRQTGRITDGSVVRYLHEFTGALLTGWVESDAGMRYFTQDGCLSTGRTAIGNKIYYFREDGYLLTGWQEIDGKTYYLAPSDGAMHTGWQEIDGKTYYFRPDGAMARGNVTINGQAHYFTSTGQPVMVVNAWNMLPAGYVPEIRELEGWPVAAECYDALSQMLSDCPHSYIISSTYRTLGGQEKIRDNRLNRYLKANYSLRRAKQLVDQYVSRPGFSEHHLGTAIDVSGSTKVCKWLAEHCWEYGFILRYPEGKSDITGIAYERWHFRYVGRELAMELYSLDITLEEYLDMLTLAEGYGGSTASNPENGLLIYETAPEEE